MRGDCSVPWVKMRGDCSVPSHGTEQSPLILTHGTEQSPLILTHGDRPRHMKLEIQVLAWDMHKKCDFHFSFLSD
jgi:hypothetical protein